MPDVLIHGDTLCSAALRHEVALAIGDPFLYLGRGGRQPWLAQDRRRRDGSVGRWTSATV